MQIDLYQGLLQIVIVPVYTKLSLFGFLFVEGGKGSSKHVFLSVHPSLFHSFTQIACSITFIFSQNISTTSGALQNEKESNCSSRKEDQNKCNVISGVRLEQLISEQRS